MAARTVAADRDTPAAERFDLRLRPAIGLRRVVARRRKRALGCLAVFHAEYLAANMVGQEGAGIVMRFQVACDPSATMEEHQQHIAGSRRARIGFRFVEPGRQAALRQIDMQVPAFDRRQVLRRCIQRIPGTLQLAAPLRCQGIGWHGTDHRCGAQ